MSTDTEGLLSSTQNTYVKDLVKLRKDGNFRKEKGRFFVEGLRSVSVALEQNRVPVVEVIVCERQLGEEHALLEQAREKKCRVVRVSRDVFKKIADVRAPQWIAAVVKIPECDLSEVMVKDALIVVVSGLQDPGNLGTLIRSCEAAGATGLVVLEGSADPFNAKVVRSTAGGVLSLPIIRTSEAKFLAEMRKMLESDAGSVRLVGTGITQGQSYKEFDWKGRPLVLCIGSEGAGISEGLAEACQETVTIPMSGQSESLNAAVAASILLFEAQH